MTSASPTIRLEAALERPFLAEGAKAILHAIFFHRLLGNVQPRTRDVLDVTFPYINEPELEATIDERISAALAAIDVRGPHPRSVGNAGNGGNGGNGSAGGHDGMNDTITEIMVLFYEQRPRRAWWGKQEDVCWEEWILRLRLLPTTFPPAVNSGQAANEPVLLAGENSDQQRSREAMACNLQSVLLNIMNAAQNTEHVPALTTNEVVTFPYQIIVPDTGEGSGWGANLLRRIA